MATEATHTLARIVAGVCLVFAVFVHADPVNAQNANKEPILTEAQCEQGFGLRQTDCRCFAKLAQRQRTDSPGRSTTLIDMEAAAACPDRTKIRNYTYNYCVDGSKLMVPRGIDAAQYCACYADVIADEHVAFAPKVHDSSTKSGFENKAIGKCKAVRASAAEAEGADLSGRWFITYRDVEFTLETPAGKWNEIELAGRRRIKQFTGPLLLANGREYGLATFWIDPIKKSFVLQLRLEGCDAAASSLESFSGRCHQSNIESRPFVMRRKK